VVGAEPSRAFVDGIWARVRKGPPDHVSGLIDRELFAGRATDAMRGAADSLCAEFGPDLVVREPCEYATAMAARDAGVAQAQVAISQAAIEAAVLDDVAAGLDRRCAGVVEAIRAAPYLTAFPALLDPSPWPDTRRYRCAPSAGRPLPDWWPTISDRPLVYVTFGSVLGGLDEAHTVYSTALDAVAELPIRVLMTVGRRFDVDALTPPSNTHVEQWVAQGDALAGADLVVCHGGSGTTNGALAAGLPLVVCPLFADQNTNAGSIERLGAGIVVRSRRRPAGGVASLDNDDKGALASAIVACLREPAYRHAAQRAASAIAATPALDELVRTFATH
jgi:UDP:flavonoid glycosyltransferase YjiC (YdhE family)